MKKNVYTTYILSIIGLVLMSFAIQTQKSAKDIVNEAYYNQRSDAFTMELSMEVIRPKWTRELNFKTWSFGRDYGLMSIQGPAKDKGTNFLRIKSEGWNWIPSIERVIKISPSQMSQSWMGSDFTNEDLLKEASIVNDYTHKSLGTENLNGTICYKIQANPKEDAAVVWGKVVLWIGKDDMLQRKAEYYDETGKLINTLTQKDFKLLDGKKIATTLEMKPAEKSGYKTLVKISYADFHADLSADFFSISNMKKLK